MHARLFFIPILLFAGTHLFAQETHTDSLNFQKNSAADSSLSIAGKYFDESDISGAFFELKKAQTLYQATGNKEGQRSVSLAFAAYYKQNLLWPDAERHYQKALSLIETDSIELSGDISFKLAEALYQQHKYENALKYAQNARDFYVKKSLKNRMAESYVQIAQIKNSQKNYIQAESLILKYALPLFRSASNGFGRISCFDVLGRSYTGQKKYSPAKWFFIQANTQSRNLKDTIGIISSLVELGKVKIAIKDYDLALRDFKEAEFLSRKKNTLSLMAEVKKAYSILYKQTGNKKAYSGYSGSLELLNDSLARIQNNRLAAASKADSNADERLKESSAIKKPALKTTGNDYVYYISGFVILIVIAGICIYLIRKARSRRS